MHQINQDSAEENKEVQEVENEEEKYSLPQLYEKRPTSSPMPMTTHGESQGDGMNTQLGKLYVTDDFL